MGRTIKGSLSIVDDLTSTSPTKALSAAKGKELEDKRVKGDGAWGLLDYKWSGRKYAPSATEPWFRADQDQTLLSANWDPLVTLLRSTPLEVGGITQFSVDSFSAAAYGVLTLVDNLTNRNLIRALLEDYLYSLSYTATTNADGSNNDTPEFSSWGMVVRVVTGFGTGGSPFTTGEEMRIGYSGSLAASLNATSRLIMVARNTVGVTSGSGLIEIYPFRVLGSTTSAKWRKIGEAGLMTPGSTYYSGTDLMEVPANLRVRDRGQGHWHEFYQDSTNLYANAPIRPGQDGADKAIASTDGNGIVRAAKTDGANGTPRLGPGTRDRAGVAYLYGYGQTYTP